VSEAFAESRTFLFFKPPRRVLRVTLRVGHRRARYERGRHVTPAVRPTARARADTETPKHTRSEDCVGTSFFTNRSLEASWVNSVRSSQRDVLVSVPFQRARSRTKP